MHALDSRLFRFQSPSFPCSKTLLKHWTFHALQSTESSDLWVSNSGLMLLILQSNVQAVKKAKQASFGKLKHTWGSSVLLSHFTYPSMHPKSCRAGRKTPFWQPICLSEVLLHDLCRSPLRGQHRTGTLHPQPQAGKFNTGTPLQSKTNVSPLLQSAKPLCCFSLTYPENSFPSPSYIQKEQGKW